MARSSVRDRLICPAIGSLLRAGASHAAWHRGRPRAPAPASLPVVVPGVAAPPRRSADPSDVLPASPDPCRRRRGRRAPRSSRRSATAAASGPRPGREPAAELPAGDAAQDEQADQRPIDEAGRGVARRRRDPEGGYRDQRRADGQIGIPVASIRPGTIRKPPPIPKKPESAPTAKPRPAASARVRDVARQDDVGRHRLAPAQHQRADHHHQRREQDQQLLPVDHLAEGEPAKRAREPAAAKTGRRATSRCPPGHGRPDCSGAYRNGDGAGADRDMRGSDTDQIDHQRDRQNRPAARRSGPSHESQTAASADLRRRGPRHGRRTCRRNWPDPRRSVPVINSTFSGTFRKRLPLASGSRQLAGAHVDLQRGDDQPRHAKRPVARLAHGDELVLADAVPYMDVVRALVGDGGFPADVAAVRAVVVAHEEPGLARQREDAPDRAVKRARHRRRGNRRAPSRRRA